MSRDTDADPIRDLQDTVLRLADRVQMLEAMLGVVVMGEDGFERRMVDVPVNLAEVPVIPQLRTRRLVAVDHDGREQVEMTTAYGGGSISAVSGGDLATYTSKVEVCSQQDGEEHDAGMWVYAHDQIVAELHAISRSDGSSDAYMDLERSCIHGRLEYVAELRGDGVSVMAERGGLFLGPCEVCDA